MDIATVKSTLVDFVRDHQAWAPFIVAGLAFAESLALLSLLVPATMLLIGIGALIATAGLPFWEIWLGAVVGAGLGDWLSYEVGRRFKHAAFQVWPLSRHPLIVTKGERFVQRFGAWGVFVGRFIGPARAVVPLVAGAFAMRAMLFQAVNWSSASLWAFVLLAPGTGLVQVFG